MLQAVCNGAGLRVIGKNLGSLGLWLHHLCVHHSPHSHSLNLSLQHSQKLFQRNKPHLQLQSIQFPCPSIQLQLLGLQRHRRSHLQQVRRLKGSGNHFEYALD